MNNFIVPFSGGCFSGKTTAMIEVQKELVARGFNCIILEEPIRQLELNSIDDIRSRPSEYLKMQLDITIPRLVKELNLNKTYDNTIILIDRAVADSLFYPLFYLDKNSLVKEELSDLHRLINTILAAGQIMYKDVYNLVFFFSPLNIKCTDTKFRPENIEVLKHIESDMIYTLTNSFRLISTKVYTWNVAHNNIYDLLNAILNNISNYEIYKNKAS